MKTHLPGHTSEETAYLVESYPYGSLRCKMTGRDLPLCSLKIQFLRACSSKVEHLLVNFPGGSLNLTERVWDVQISSCQP